MTKLIKDADEVSTEDITEKLSARQAIKTILNRYFKKLENNTENNDIKYLNFMIAANADITSTKLDLVYKTLKQTNDALLSEVTSGNGILIDSTISIAGGYLVYDYRYTINTKRDRVNVDHDDDYGAYSTSDTKRLKYAIIRKGSDSENVKDIKGGVSAATDGNRQTTINLGDDWVKDASVKTTNTTFGAMKKNLIKNLLSHSKDGFSKLEKFVDVLGDEIVKIGQINSESNYKKIADNLSKQGLSDGNIATVIKTHTQITRSCIKILTDVIKATVSYTKTYDQLWSKFMELNKMASGIDL